MAKGEDVCVTISCNDLFFQICVLTKVAMIHNDTYKNLSRFGYKLNVKVIFKNQSFILLATCFNHVEICKVVLNFGWNMAIENILKHINLLHLIFK